MFSRVQNSGVTESTSVKSGITLDRPLDKEFSSLCVRGNLLDPAQRTPTTHDLDSRLNANFPSWTQGEGGIFQANSWEIFPSLAL